MGTKEVTEDEKAFCMACADVRKAWGSRTSTWDQICSLLGEAIWLSTRPGVDQVFAQTAIDAMWMEWIQFRSIHFMFQETRPTACLAVLSRWPNGTHYYVRVSVGPNYLADEKFNDVDEAEACLQKAIRGLSDVKIIRKT